MTPPTEGGDVVEVIGFRPVCPKCAWPAQIAADRATAEQWLADHLAGWHHPTEVET